MSTDDEHEEMTKITRKGQVTIPKPLREEFDLKPGDEVVWKPGEDGIIVRKADRGSARGMLVPDDISEEKRAEVADELERRVREHRETIEARLADED